jgi:hypothetical protein
MPKYRVAVKGTNLLSDVDGVRKQLGFHTNVYVECTTSTEAETRAVDVLRTDARLKALAANEDANPPVFSVTSIEEIKSFDGLCLPRTGLAMFEE